ncbi:MAG: DUF4113 domain-containing protein, partial [Proteobacteria bacterium]|nr:DUF4113 domain-containing protein [Pseudomonadota bacterium]
MYDVIVLGLGAMGYWAAEVDVGVRFVGGGRGGYRVAVPATQDTFTLVRAVDEIWSDIKRINGPQDIKQVSVTLCKLSQEPCFDLFTPTHEEKAHLRRISLSRALDDLNRRYGRDTVTLGVQPTMRGDYVG